MKRAWIWLYNSPWFPLALSLYLFYAYSQQSGWQRWLLFAVACGEAVLFWKRADDEWLIKK